MFRPQCVDRTQLLRQRGVACLLRLVQCAAETLQRGGLGASQQCQRVRRKEKLAEHERHTGSEQGVQYPVDARLLAGRYGDHRTHGSLGHHDALAIDEQRHEQRAQDGCAEGQSVVAGESSASCPTTIPAMIPDRTRMALVPRPPTGVLAAVSATSKVVPSTATTPAPATDGRHDVIRWRGGPTRPPLTCQQPTALPTTPLTKPDSETLLEH
ncbi:hypothetical protein ADL07_26520 [Streptomyces sp. NRRL F-4707]|nr:hypothetical protein ADL07_26520 [Streptomyces sp. NRRL F-4707]